MLTGPSPRVLPRAVLQSEELLLRSPEQRLRLLDCVFLRFDELVGEHPGALKIETVGGVYLVAANSACSSRLLLYYVYFHHKSA